MDLAGAAGPMAGGYHLGGAVSARGAETGATRLWTWALAASLWLAGVGTFGDRLVGVLAPLDLVTGPLVGTLVLPLGVGLLPTRAGSGRSAGRPTAAWCGA